MRMAYKQLAKFGDNFKDGLHKPTFREDGLNAPTEADNFKDGLHKPTFQRMAYMRQRRPTISRMVFTSPPSMRMAYKQLAKFGDNLKEGLHKPNLHEDGLHAPMEADDFKKVFTSPPSMRMAYMRQWRPTISRKVFTSPPSMRMACKQLAEFGNNFRDGPHKPTFHEDGLQAVGQSSATISRMVFTSPPSMRMAYMRQWRPAISRMVFTSPPSMRWLTCPNGGRQSQGWSSQAHLP